MEGARFELNWRVSKRNFKGQVNDLVKFCQENGKVIPLPIFARGVAAINILAALLCQVNCDKCDAPCCRSNPDGSPMEVLPPELPRLKKLGLKGGTVPWPCPFLKDERCSIYSDRPLVCVFYPFQPGGTDAGGNDIISLASSCPESRRVARNYLMMEWRLRNSFFVLGESFLEHLFGKKR